MKPTQAGDMMSTVNRRTKGARNIFKVFLPCVPLPYWIPYRIFGMTSFSNAALDFDLLLDSGWGVSLLQNLPMDYIFKQFPNHCQDQIMDWQSIVKLYAFLSSFMIFFWTEPGKHIRQCHNEILPWNTYLVLEVFRAHVATWNKLFANQGYAMVLLCCPKAISQV